uniref:Uncharacterized protein n=1 Tax=Tetranychus urticae TaxID=32264 RepID=T1L651_TETUR
MIGHESRYKPYVLRVNVNCVANESDNRENGRYVTFKCFGFNCFGKIISASVNMSKVESAITMTREKLHSLDKNLVLWDHEDIIYNVMNLTMLDAADLEMVQKSKIYQTLDMKKQLNQKLETQIDRIPNESFNKGMKISKTKHDNVNVNSLSGESAGTAFVKKEPRLRMHDPEILRSIIMKKEESKKRIESDISSIMDRINELSPLINATDICSIMVNKIVDFMKLLNEKIQIMDDLRHKDFAVFKTSRYNVNVDSDKGVVMVPGIRTGFPVDGYATAMTREKPKHVVSILMRKCIDPSLKEGAKIRDDYDKNNFIMRLGESHLTDFAHHLRGIQEYGMNEYKACLRQVRKALEDFNRPDRAVKKPKNETIITIEDDDEKTMKSVNKKFMLDEPSTSRKTSSFDYDEDDNFSRFPSSLSKKRFFDDETSSASSNESDSSTRHYEPKKKYRISDQDSDAE